MAYLVAAALVLPLLAPEVWGGFRLGPADNVLGTIAPTEQPMSLRSPGGEWAIGLALVWFALAYWRRSPTWWQPILVILGTTAALIRSGNAWLDAVALVVPLGVQISSLRLPHRVVVAAAAIGLLTAAFTVWTTRPPALPQAAVTAAQGVPGTVFAEWQWAPQLQRDLGPDHHVLAAAGLASETPSFWLDYVRITQDYEQWPSELRGLNADVLVLSTDYPVVEQVRSSAAWHVVYDGGGALVAQRAEP
ncbi:MAG: hypothetical protein JO020_01790 [Chloroflexi bacterium]|nr:hypothetical protein [Chloroflexota bacterium]